MFIGILLLTLSPLHVIECHPGFPTRCAVPLRANDLAPFDGQMITEDLAIFLGQSTENCKERIDIAVTATSSYAREKLRYAQRIHDIDLQDATRRATRAEQALEEGQPLIEHPLIVAGITAGIIVLIFAVAKTSDNLRDL